jgi:hypothetical protein
MNARRWFFSGVAVCLNIPVFVSAQQGLVPCGRVGQEDCQTCHVVQLVSGVNAWLVGILSIVATIMFVIAGFKLVTSNGNPSALQDAKNMIINVAIGFVIVLAAWLLLDLFMKSLLSDSQQGLGPWNQISCVDQPVATTDPGWLNIQILDATALEQANGSVDGSLAPEAYAAGDCSITNLQANGFTAQQAQVMSCIAQPESGCDNNADASNNGLNSSARGVFQIVYGYSDACHSLRLPECTAANGGVALNCGKSDDTPGSACNKAASNFACNAAAAKCLLNAEASGVSAGYQHWLADSRASVQASCVKEYAD